MSVNSHYFFPSFGQLSNAISKNDGLLRQSTNRFIFSLLHKSGNADEPGRVPSIETNGSRKEQRLQSTASGVRPPISAFRHGEKFSRTVALAVGKPLLFGLV